jgi:hypothetical protein
MRFGAKSFSPRTPRSRGSPRKRSYSFLGEPQLLGVLGDRLFAPSRMNHRVRTVFVNLTQALPQTQVIVRVG